MHALNTSTPNETPAPQPLPDALAIGGDAPPAPQHIPDALAIGGDAPPASQHIPDVAVIGTGGIGGYYGARLARSGAANVHFYARTDWQSMRAHGLSVDSVHGDFSLARPDAYGDIADMPPCDIALVCVKATANDAVFPKLAPVLKPGAAIVLMQNGLGNDAKLGALYPDAHVFGGMCFICSFRTAPCAIRHTSYGKVSLAPLRPESGPHAERVLALLSGAGIETEYFQDLALARWRKLVWNIPYNGLTVVMDCKTDFLAQDPSMRELVRLVMGEVLGAAAACGVSIERAFIDAMIRSTDRMPPYEPSMRLDFLAGLPLETDAIYGGAIRAAAERGYDMRYAKSIMLGLEALSRRSR